MYIYMIDSPLHACHESLYMRECVKRFYIREQRVPCVVAKTEGSVLWTWVYPGAIRYALTAPDVDGCLYVTTMNVMVLL